MIVQIKAISSKTTQQAELLFRERAAQLRARVAEKIADEIINLSPVDTGTYIMAHAAGTAESNESAGRTSHGKKRGRNEQQFRNLARGNLKRSVSAQALKAGNEVWFRNRAEHAQIVEVWGWETRGGPGPARVYAQARARAPQFIREAAREMGFMSR